MTGNDGGVASTTWGRRSVLLVDDISLEGLRALLREEGVSFQRLKTFKVSNDPHYEAKKNRVLELYAIADGQVVPGADDRR